MLSTKVASKGEHAMSDLDIEALEANFEVWKKDRASHLPNDKAFERFVIDQILKDAELTDEEIASGNLGGPDDGGIDAMYFFVNRILIQDETEIPDNAITAELYLIQAKYESGFGENTVERMNVFVRDMLDFAKPVDSFIYLNSYAKDAIERFRRGYTAILASHHTFTISLYYAIKGDVPPNTKVIKRVEVLRDFVKNRLSAAQVDFQFWGCAQLLSAARTSPKRKLTVNFTKHFMTSDKAVVCLVKLQDFAEFLRNERGDIRRSVLEPNVRDYQGKRNPVNTDIRKTLENSNGTEFWWLNNGITLLATDSSIAGDTLTINDPEIVNGLQTSQEIFNYFRDNRDKQDSRNILIRVILPPGEQTRTKITKATNFQTEVPPVSLHATDQIHFDIEDRLKLYDFFYDRRKGYYKNQRKPMAQIISILDVARPVIAIYLREPNQARGRPQTLLNNEAKYKTIFHDEYDRNMYVVCVLLDRQVEEHLSKQTALTKDERRDARYYTDMVLTCNLLKSARPSLKEICSLLPICVRPIEETLIGGARQEVLKAYHELGGTEKIAKSVDLRNKLVSQIEERFPVPGESKQSPLGNS
jgi:AIPR protein